EPLELADRRVVLAIVDALELDTGHHGARPLVGGRLEAKEVGHGAHCARPRRQRQARSDAACPWNYLEMWPTSAQNASRRSPKRRWASACIMWPAPFSVSKVARGSAASSACRVGPKYGAERSPPRSRTGVLTAASCM